MADEGGGPSPPSGETPTDRCVKKAKGSVLGEEEKQELALIAFQVGESSRASRGPKSVSDDKQSGRPFSYKEKLLRLNGGNTEPESDEEDWISRQRREEEEDDAMGQEEEGSGDNPLRPIYRYDLAAHKENCKKWRMSLIVKLMGKRIGAFFFQNRLRKLWNPRGGFEFIHLGNGYFLAKFTDSEDYAHVLHEGPWVITDHYVSVQRWKPCFNPRDDSLKRMAVWVRIPWLPIEYYTRQHLWGLGNLLGRTLKIDQASMRRNEAGEGERTDKAQFARICVEVDLRKTLIPEVEVKGEVFQVGYEGLHLICFSCGQYGHRNDLCPHNVKVQKTQEKGSEEKEEEHPGVQEIPMTHAEDKEREAGKECDAFGGWMVVQKRKNKKVNKSKVITNQRGSTPKVEAKISSGLQKQTVSQQGGRLDPIAKERVISKALVPLEGSMTLKSDILAPKSMPGDVVLSSLLNKKGQSSRAGKSQNQEVIPKVMEFKSKKRLASEKGQVKIVATTGKGRNQAISKGKSTTQEVTMGKEVSSRTVIRKEVGGILDSSESSEGRLDKVIPVTDKPPDVIQLMKWYAQAHKKEVALQEITNLGGAFGFDDRL